MMIAADLGQYGGNSVAGNAGRSDRPASCRLAPFDPAWAKLLISWVHDEREMYWLAPKTPPPLTIGEILGWRRPDHDPYALLLPGRPEPIGYGELNPMTGARREYWLGHLIVDPAFRGRGYGAQLTRLLLQEAFEQRGARRVTLVVFPDNQPALACYRAAGMRDDGHEWHTFPAYGRQECLIRLAATWPL
jgi:RimJ/RimL family protein N-acetyltransferase